MEFKEIWKTIEDYTNYQISNYGKIKSFKRYKNGKILKQIKDTHGYFYINLYKNSKLKHKFIHHLVYETFNDYKLKKNECVHHKDENEINNNLYNLEKMNKFEHKSLHMSGENHPFYKKKRPEFSGENHPRAILTKQEVVEIKKLDLSQRKIAKIFGISHGTVSSIKTGRTWKHII